MEKRNILFIQYEDIVSPCVKTQVVLNLTKANIPYILADLINSKGKQYGNNKRTR